jgi:glycosyltransferase involved in cell wall biosynthesis
MDLTVLIPVHNTPAHHLLEAVRCITEQDDGGNHRIILIDDASHRKDTLWALKWLSEQDGIDLIRMKWNSGISGALNEGHRHVKTEYVAHIDSDDICSRNRFRLMIERLEQNPEIDVLGCQLFSFWNDDITRAPAFISQHPVNPEPNEDGRAWLVNHASIIIKQKSFEASGGYATELWRAQDVDLWSRMYEMGFIFENLPDVLYGWRRYRSSSSVSSPSIES